MKPCSPRFWIDRAVFRVFYAFVIVVRKLRYVQRLAAILFFQAVIFIDIDQHTHRGSMFGDETG